MQESQETRSQGSNSRVGHQQEEVKRRILTWKGMGTFLLYKNNGDQIGMGEYLKRTCFYHLLNMQL